VSRGYPYNIIVETVKFAEDKSGYIVRLYECLGKRTLADICVKGMKSAVMTNLTEIEHFELKINKNNIQLNFKPFEIHTIKVKV
jgi:alpha-mannosidase